MEVVQSSPHKRDQIQVWKSNGCGSTNYKNETHMVKVFEVLQSLRKDEVLCDIRLQTDDGTIVFAHKVVLISASPYFHSMLTKFYESNKDIVNIRELDSTVLKLLVDYIYTSEIMVTEQNVQVLLPAADLLQFDYVKDVCAEFLQTHLSASNCIGIKALAILHNCVELLASSDKFIKKQFLEVVKHDEFLSLSIEEVIELVSSNDIAFGFEEKVFECVINWVQHKLDSRNDSFSELMKHVRLPLVSIEYISEKVLNEPLIKNSAKCKEYVIEAFNFHFIKARQHITIPQTIRTTPRSSGSEQVMVVFSLNITSWYDLTTNAWKIARRIGNLMEIAPIALIKKNYLFSVGSALDCTRSVNMLDLTLESPYWVSTENMLVGRSHLSIAVLDDCIYAVGGGNQSGPSLFNSAEVFDIRIQKWRMISSMSSKRMSLGVGVLNNRLYAVGGYDGLSILKSVECYHPNNDTWTTVAEMSECRRFHGIGVLHGVMYAVGGTNATEALKSVEAFSPSTGVWSSIADMHMCRINPGVLVLEGLLYAIGGCNGEKNLDSMEIYNPSTNSWSMESMSVEMAFIHGAIVINRPSYFKIN